jgi:hypothetical protein
MLQTESIGVKQQVIKNTSTTRIFAPNTSALFGSRMKSDVVSPVKAISGVDTVFVICKFKIGEW